MKAFASNNDVAFMDVNLSQERITDGPNGEAYNPGKGGWPTIHYFNEETGLAGGVYEKKTNGHMCDELGDENMLTAYIEEYGNTSTCSVETAQGCGEREVGYIEKMKGKSKEEQKAQLDRLVEMEGSSMKPDLLAWLKQRKKILKQLVAAGGDEL